MIQTAALFVASKGDITFSFAAFKKSTPALISCNHMRLTKKKMHYIGYRGVTAQIRQDTSILQVIQQICRISKSRGNISSQRAEIKVDSTPNT